MKRSVAVWILAAALVIAALGAAYVSLRRPAGSSGTSSPPSVEETAYLSQIRVTDSQMSAAQNYIGDRIFYFDAKVTNGGSKSVRTIELQLEYVDTLAQVVLRESAYPVTSRMPPLEAGNTRAFRVSYDHMPADWNQAPPKVTVIRVGF
jgi:hypothetical protein